MKRIASVALAVLPLVLGGFAGMVNASKQTPWCSISPTMAAVGQTYVVHAGGLPILQPINLWVIRPDGTLADNTGPLGSSPDGTFNLNEVSYTRGVWTYIFSGAVLRNGNTKVYATCSMEAY